MLSVSRLSWNLVVIVAHSPRLARDHGSCCLDSLAVWLSKRSACVGLSVFRMSRSLRCPGYHVSSCHGHLCTTSLYLGVQSSPVSWHLNMHVCVRASRGSVMVPGRSNAAGGVQKLISLKTSQQLKLETAAEPRASHSRTIPPNNFFCRTLSAVGPDCQHDLKRKPATSGMFGDPAPAQVEPLAPVQKPGGVCRQAGVAHPKQFRREGTLRVN